MNDEQATRTDVTEALKSAQNYLLFYKSDPQCNLSIPFLQAVCCYDEEIKVKKLNEFTPLFACFQNILNTDI